MMLGGTPFGANVLGGLTARSNVLVEEQNTYPLTVLHNNVRATMKPNSLVVEEATDQSVTMACVFANPADSPQAGDVIEVRYFDFILFKGTLERVELKIVTSGGARFYSCKGIDWSQSLSRRRVRRQFTDITMPALAGSLLENEASGEGFVFGSTDQQAIMTMVDADNSNVLDVLRGAAAIGGQSCEISFDKVIRFRSSSYPPAPIPLTNDVVENPIIVEDREDYCNVQTVVAKGTAQVEGEKPIEVVEVQTNDAQIAERQSIEGGSGRYEQIDSVTHPSSNTQAIVARLAATYAEVLLATRGTLRRVLRCGVRYYGFRVGQVATVDLPEHNATGEWSVQRVTVREEVGKRLLYELELAPSYFQYRSSSIWAQILKKGKLVITSPGNALSATVDLFETPGSYQWISPITGTITITTIGGSGGGGGAARKVCAGDTIYSYGGRGGPSGKTVSSVSVAVGDVLDIVVGSKGTAGAGGNGGCTGDTFGVTGSVGGTSSVSRSGIILNRAYGGGGGIRGRAYTSTDVGCIKRAPGATGASGGGSDGIVTVGGGKTGGVGGTASCSVSAQSGSHGQDGMAMIEY